VRNRSHTAAGSAGELVHVGIYGATGALAVRLAMLASSVTNALLGLTSLRAGLEIVFPYAA
jgi:hypothetical protein